MPFAAGAAFQCLLDIVPIKNEKHEVVLFLASHKDVSKSDADNLSGDEAEAEESAESPTPADVSNPYHRRRSRAVLYQLSGHYRRSDTVKSKLKLNNVSSSDLCCVSRCLFPAFPTLPLHCASS